MERLWLHGNSKSLSNPQPFYFSRNEKYVQLIFYKEKNKTNKTNANVHTSVQQCQQVMSIESNQWVQVGTAVVNK